MSNQTGIYQILNLTNNKCYIGSTAVGFHDRWRDHKSLLRCNRHHSPILQNAWNKYGAEVFRWIVVEICQPEQCIEREQYWLNTTQPEYNICRTAGSSLGRKHSTATKAKIAKGHIGICRPHTEQTKQKISRSKKGVPIPKLQGQNHPRSKLSNNDIRFIQKHYLAGISTTTLTIRFGVHNTTITRAIHRRVLCKSS